MLDLQQFNSRYATPGDILAWAEEVMASRPPEIVIGGNYMERWYILPRSEYSNVYLHRVLRSDDARALHDHPWDNASLVLSGGYTEVTPEGEFWRPPGYYASRLATARHRLVINEPAVSLFTTGPKVRDWGFWPVQPDGTTTFVPWQEWA